MTTPTVCLLLLFSLESGHTDHSGDAGGTGGARANVAEKMQPPLAAAAAGADIADNLSRIDLLHRQRDDQRALNEERKLLDTGLARTPRDYDFLWRAARFYFWLSDDPASANEERSKTGKIAWDFAERAIVANPNQADGYYWAAVSMGNYAVGLGVVKALTMGMEEKFRSRLERAGQLSPGYQFGGVDLAWGRFYEKLPWPKRDRKKAETHLRRVLTQLNPNSLRARVYLADTLAHDDRAAEARKLLDDVAAAPVGRYDAPEERRAKALAKGLLPSVMTVAK